MSTPLVYDHDYVTTWTPVAEVQPGSPFEVGEPFPDMEKPCFVDGCGLPLMLHVRMSLLPVGAARCVTAGHEDEPAVGRAWFWADEHEEVHGDYCGECLDSMEKAGDRVVRWTTQEQASEQKGGA